MDNFRRIQLETGWGKNLQTFAAWCAPAPGAVILDVGCGPGLLPALFSRQAAWAVGIDLDVSALRQDALHGDLIAGRADQLPFSSQTFQLITASNVLFFLPDPGAVLRALRRVIQPGGQLCLLNPSEGMSLDVVNRLVAEKGLEGLARQSLLGWAERAEQNQRWDEQQTEALLRAAGWTLVESRLAIGPGLARFSRGILSAHPTQSETNL